MAATAFSSGRWRFQQKTAHHSERERRFPSHFGCGSAAVCEAVRARESRRGRVAETAVAVERQAAVAGVADQDGAQRVVLEVRIVAQHARGVDAEGLSL